MVEDNENGVAVTEASAIDQLQPKMRIKGKVTRTELYGAFLDVGVGHEAIIHISQLGKKVNRVGDVLNVGDEVEVWIDKVDPEKGQVIVSMVEPLAVDWSDLRDGQVYTGKVTRLENFGAFTDIGAEKDGLIHVSELSHDYVKHPSEVVNVGDEIQVKILGFSRKKRRINLSIKALQEAPGREPAVAEYAEFVEEEEFGEMPTAMEIALKRALGDDVEVDVTRKQRRGGRNKKRRRREAQEDVLRRTLEMSKS